MFSNKTNETIMLFWAQSHCESMSLLQEAINSKNAVFWDNVLVTAATKAQSDIYSRMIADRISDKYIPSRCEYYVQPDRDESRIGSGGATLCALVRLLAECGGDIDKFVSQRSLVLHSGGAAKRLPHSAPWGKLFAMSGSNIGDDIRNPPSAVFDDLMVTMAGIPERMTNGVLIVAADAFFRFSHSQFDLSSQNAVAFSTKTDVAVGTVHGTYIEKDGYVSEFLHKLSEAKLREKNAVSNLDLVDLDIGITFLGENAIRALLELVSNERGEVDESAISKYANANVNLSFYGDIIYPMAADSTVEEFLLQDGDGPVSEELCKLRPGIFNALHPIPLQLFRLAPGTIRNMGTTKEALETLAFFNNEAVFKNNDEYDANIALNSKISPNAVAGANCYIEDSYINEGVKIGMGCLISGCDLNCGDEIPDDTAMHCIVLKSGKWVCRVWGVHDDVKSSATWLGRPIKSWDLEAESLWTARLFPVCESKIEAIKWAVAVTSDSITKDLYDKWHAAERLSLSDISEIDIDSLIHERKKREHEIRVDAFADRIINGISVKDSIGILGTGSNALHRVSMIKSRLEKGYYKTWRDEMRLYISISEVVNLLSIDIDADGLQNKGFMALRRVLTDLNPIVYDELIKWTCERTEVFQPVRVNFAGSWSDAPPYCLEHGGTIINAAVSINNELPVSILAERIEQPHVELKSVDLSAERIFSDLEPLLAYQDVTDPFMLFKAALHCAGIISVDGGTLKKQLERLGGGVRLTSKVNVPRGSGLGTSSILTGALINALLKLSGRSKNYCELSNDILAAEQRMTTGGGWQDAIGGMYPGIKLIFTEPGIPQRYDVQTLDITDSATYELNRRSILLYTGQRRVAKIALTRVLSNYICNRPESLTALQEMQRLAYIMTYELHRGNISSFGLLLNTHMYLLKQLDASCTNLMIEYILRGLYKFVEGASICGAGGGGHMYGILKSDVTMSDVQSWINSEFDGTGVRIYSCGIVKA
jgi:fucokinase